MEEKLKVGFLFGAGAEVSYGMPTGGKFALEIFRRDTSQSKEIFKKNRDRIKPSSQYATVCLPEEYEQKRVSVFRESVYENIIKDTITNNREVIIERINNLDRICDSILDKGIDSFYEEVERDLGIIRTEINVKQLLQYNSIFSKGNALFDSNFFAIMLTYYKYFSDFSDETDKEKLGDIIKSILQLHIGAMSVTLTRDLKENLFKKEKLELDIFDDLGASISVNYQHAGVKGLELLSKKVSDSSSKVVKVVYEVIEKVYADVLDYKSVIDSNWHYLYIPKKEWGKFCNIGIFLHSVREYIETAGNDVKNNKGYYDDLNNVDAIDITTIGTSNYVNNLIKSKIERFKDIIFLNGSIDEYYDPYMNNIISESEFQNFERFAFPLIFTQSGTKPMTSIDVSKKYVYFYDKLKQSDRICSIGFGFNEDDEHINGIIRTLIEKEDKKLIVVELNKGEKEAIIKRNISFKLKTSKIENIDVILVNIDRKVDNMIWTKYLLENFLETSNT